MSMKVPEIVRQTKEALQNGYSVVIGLQTTGEVSRWVVSFFSFKKNSTFCIFFFFLRSVQIEPTFRPTFQPTCWYDLLYTWQRLGQHFSQYLKINSTGFVVV